MLLNDFTGFITYNIRQIKLKLQTLPKIFKSLKEDILKSHCPSICLSSTLWAVTLSCMMYIYNMTQVFSTYHNDVWYPVPKCQSHPCRHLCWDFYSYAIKDL